MNAVVVTPALDAAARRFSPPHGGGRQLAPSFDLVLDGVNSADRAGISPNVEKPTPGGSHSQIATNARGATLIDAPQAAAVEAALAALGCVAAPATTNLPTVGGYASAAAPKSRAPSARNVSGGEEARSTGSTSPRPCDLPKSDASLGVRDVQSRTHLAPAVAAPARDLHSTAGPPAVVNPALADARAQRGAGARPEGAADKTSTTAQALELPFAAAQTSATKDLLATPFAPIGLDQLPSFVADQSSAFIAQATAAPAPRVTAASAPGAVKELEIALDPADLGAVTLKMRLANGKLSVEIGVCNPSTLTAIAHERDAIADRLSSSAQPLENLVIRSEPAASITSGSDDANRFSGSGQTGANANSSGASPGERQDPSASRDPRRVARDADAQAPSGGGAGDLRV